MSKKVLVLGGGFGALESAIYLRKYGFDVTVITNTFLLILLSL